jgi:hypothetical protein
VVQFKLLEPVLRALAAKKEGDERDEELRKLLEKFCSQYLLARVSETLADMKQTS